jgi:hypothetical protein
MAVDRFHLEFLEREKEEVGPLRDTAFYRQHNRIIQSITMMAAMIAVNTATQGPLGTHTYQRPRAAHQSNQGPATANNPARIVPPTFARSASPKRPRTT